jgi:hypothetical protein
MALAETRTPQATFACTVHVAWHASLQWLSQVDWLSDAHCPAHVPVHWALQKDAHWYGFRAAAHSALHCAPHWALQLELQSDAAFAWQSPAQ